LIEYKPCSADEEVQYTTLRRLYALQGTAVGATGNMQPFLFSLSFLGLAGVQSSKMFGQLFVFMSGLSIC